MYKQHKKLYKAGKNWVVATLTATTITLLGGIGAYTAHADTTIESSQDVQTTSVNQTNQVDNSNNSVTLNNNQPVAVQGSQAAQNDQSVQGNQTNQTVPSSATAAADTSNSDSLDPNIYGTVNVKDWDYQKGNNIINLTGYHGADLQHVIVPNLNDFNNANVDVNGVKNVDITSTVLKNVLGRLNSQNSTVAISKTDGSLNSKVVAEDNNWAATFAEGVKSKLEYADLTNLDTSKITNMAFLFDGQDHLKVLTGLDSWNTSNVISMKQMFQNDSELTALNLSNWDTSSATDMSSMFNMCNSARTFGDLSNWNTSNVTDMLGMFSEADSLQTVGNLDNWNTSNVTNMADMFNDTDNLQSIGNLSNWDTSKVTDMMGMFESTAKLQTVGDLSNWDTSKVTNMEEMFYFSHIQTAGDLGNWDTSNVTDMSYMFNNAINLQSVGDLSKWDTSNVTNMSCMFYNANKLQSVGDLSKWDTSSVTDMSDMFGSLIQLSSIGDLSNWNTSNVTNMSGMFIADKNLQSVGDLSKWDTSSVTDMSGMFCGDINLQSVGDLSKWDTSNVTDMSEVLLNSKIDYFVVSRSDNSFINTLHLIDSNGLMGQPGETIATIKAPTFYKLEPDGNKMQSVYDTVFPLVQKKANEEYKNFLNGLTEGMRNIYPTKVTLKMVISEEWSPTPANNANATFTYNMKIGTLKDFVINYVDKTGNVVNIVGSEMLKGVIGSTIPLPKKLSLPSGYQLVNGQDIPTSVTIKEGKLQTIDVYVEKTSKAPVVQTGLINYVDQDGKVVKTDKISGKVGDKIDVKISLPDGYELANKDEQIPNTITVYDDGIKTITINVKKIPRIQTGTINYVDENGKVIKTDTVSGVVGTSIPVKIVIPDGYELANKDEQLPTVITVTENGIGTINVNVKKINTTNTGWNQQGDDWLYMQNNGYLAKGWNYLNGHWFYFDLQSGIMKTGVQPIGNSFYYLNTQHDGTYGAMKTGWQFVNGHWIGLQGSGNAYVGWQAINGHWYYFDPQTAYALTNWQDINNHWYYFDPTNAWAQTGWFKSGAGYWYFFDYANAWADTGWQKINNHWYYFDNTNANALTGWQSINSHWYYFDPTNAWALTGWQYINGHWYWFDQANAWARTGWQYYGGQWYFMDQQNAWMDTGWTTNLANGQLYYLDKNGHPLTGWQRSLNGFWYYLQPGSDATAIGWKQINGNWYYFNPEETINGIKAKGAMFTGHQLIANRWSYFDQYGHWLGYEN